MLGGEGKGDIIMGGLEIRLEHVICIGRALNIIIRVYTIWRGMGSVWRGGATYYMILYINIFLPR